MSTSSGLILSLLLLLLARPAHVLAQGSPPEPAAHLEARTLRELLVAERIDATGLAPAALDRRIMSYAYENAARYFTAGYYVETGGKGLPDALHVTVFDKTKRAWLDASIRQRGVRRDFGSVMSVRHIDALIYVEMHLNPSASHTLVLSPRLERVMSLYGWTLRALPDGSVLFHNSQRHFAPTHTFELSLFDAKTRRVQRVYPVKPYQPLRRAFVARVRAAYEAETRRDPEWARLQNHHGDPELFDSAFREPLVIAPGGRRFAFVVRFGDDHARPPTPTEDVIVSCDLTKAPADRCGEMPKAEWQQRHPTFTDEGLLKVILRQPHP